MMRRQKVTINEQGLRKYDYSLDPRAENPLPCFNMSRLNDPWTEVVHVVRWSKRNHRRYMSADTKAMVFHLLLSMRRIGIPTELCEMVLEAGAVPDEEYVVDINLLWS